MSDLERYNAIYVPGKMLDTPWAAHYIIYDFFLKQADDVPTLDLCCGTGAGTKMIAEALTASVIGADYSFDALLTAQMLNSLPDVGTGYINVDLNNDNDLDALADVIDDCNVTQCFIVEGLEHLYQPERVIDTLLNAGVERIFVSTPIELPGKAPAGFHVSPFTPERVAKLQASLEASDYTLRTLGYALPLALPVSPGMAARAIVTEKPVQGGNYLWEIS